MKQLRTVGVGTNPAIGSLFCFSCRQHCRRANEDKWTHIDHVYEIRVYLGGRFELQTDQETDGELQQAIIDEFTAITEDDFEPFGEGVAVAFYDYRMECASCGSQEFVAPSPADKDSQTRNPS